MQIIPAILTDQPTEVTERLEQLSDLSLAVQVDFMDGQFVPSKSIRPEELPKDIKNNEWEAHLMVADPLGFAARLYPYGCKKIYWHIETLSANFSWPYLSSEVDHGAALLIDTPISKLEPYLPHIQSVLLMSIARPGFQGEKFDERVWSKISQLKKMYPRLKITVDGGVKIEHVRLLANAGVDAAVIGSAFWQFGDIKQTLAALRQATL